MPENPAPMILTFRCREFSIGSSLIVNAGAADPMMGRADKTLLSSRRERANESATLFDINTDLKIQYYKIKVIQSLCLEAEKG